MSSNSNKPSPARVSISTTDMLNSLALETTPNCKLDLVVAHKLVTLQQRCKDKNVEFNLSFKRLKQLMQQETCFYSGIKFDTSIKHFQRTLDRVDNNKGYSDDNVVACTFILNQKKADMTIKQLKLLIRGISKFEKRHKAKAKPTAKVGKLTIVKQVKSA